MAYICYVNFYAYKEIVLLSYIGNIAITFILASCLRLCQQEHHLMMMIITGVLTTSSSQPLPRLPSKSQKMLEIRQDTLEVGPSVSIDFMGGPGCWVKTHDCGHLRMDGWGSGHRPDNANASLLGLKYLGG